VNKVEFQLLPDRFLIDELNRGNDPRNLGDHACDDC
jgi:hypothetical protein